MYRHLTTFLSALVLMIICMSPMFTLIGLTLEDVPDPIEPSSNDLWNCLSEFQESSSLYDMLSENGWIDEEFVTFLDFDYILVMADQICTMNPNVRLSLVLATIAKESRFDAYCEHKGAKGLMQLTEIIIRSRMLPFIEQGHTISEDDIFDVRLNLATGVDYLNYILEETNGDEAYALMWYSQGPKSASKDYIDNFYTSDYALDIITLANQIESYLITSGRVE